MVWQNLCVESGFGGEETVNFGPRQETGSSLYQIDTLATITSADEGKGSPSILALSNASGLSLALDNSLVIFDESCTRHAMTFTFGNQVSALAWADDSRFLAVAERCSPVLHLIHLQTETKLTMHPNDMVTAGATVTSMVFTKGNSPDDVVLDMICDNGRLLRLADIMLNQLNKAVQERNMEEIQRVQKLVQKIALDTASSDGHGHSSCLQPTDSYLTLENGNVLIADSGLSEWSVCLGNITRVPFYLEPDCGITKMRKTRNEDYLITLNSAGHLAIWDLLTYEVVSFWLDMEIQDFVLFSTNLLEQDKPSGAVFEDMKIVVLTKGEQKKSLLQVFTLPQREHVYTLQVSACSKLADLDENQDSIYFIEGVENLLNDSCEEEEFAFEKDGMDIETIRIRCLTEAFPENRFSRLLYKKHFDKAEAFAKEYGLAVELVYKVKATFLLDALWPPGSSQSIHVPDYKCVAEELKKCLNQIKDLEYVINCCLKAQMPTFEATYDMLMYGKEYFESLNSKQNTSSPAVQSLLEGLNRLVTFKVAFGLKKFSGPIWNAFLNASIFDEVTKCFLANQFGPGILLWRRHQREFEDDFSNAKLSEILKSISPSVPSEKIIPWLKEDFVPFVLTVLPTGQNILAHWLCERACSMEFSEAHAWPQNALEMAEVMFKAFQEVAKTKHGRGFATPDQFATQICKVSLAFGPYDINTSLSENKVQGSAMVQLSDLVKGLREVYLLHSKYACKLSFDEYYKENTKTIAFKLLDRVPAAELIPNTIELYVRPYAKNHNFKLDKLLSDYIENLLANGKKDSRFREAKIVAIIHSISSPELRCSAVLLFLGKASIPWSEEVQDIVDKTVKENPTNALLKNQLQLTEAKKILLGHGVSVVTFNMSDSAKIEGFIKSIIKSGGENALDDALKIGKMYFQSTQKVHFFQLSHWLLSGKAGECCGFLKSVELSIALNSGIQIINYALVCLEDQPVDKEDEESLQIITEGAIDVMRTLSMLDEDFKIKYRQALLDLKSILALQREYGIYVSRQEFEDELQRENLFDTYVKKIKENNNKEKVSVAEELKIKRIAVILRCHPLYMRYAVEKALLSRNLEAEIDKLFSTLCSGTPSSETFKLLKRVILSFLLENVSNLGSHGITIWAKYVEKFYDVACYCLSFCDADDLRDFFEMARNLSMSLAVSLQFESSDYEEDLQGKTDHFAKKMFDKIFEDDGLILNGSDMIPLLTKLNMATFNPHCSEAVRFKTQHISGWIATSRYKGDAEQYPIPSIMKFSHSICQILHENNLYTRAHQYALQCLENCLRHHSIINGRYEVPSQLISKEFRTIMEQTKKVVDDVVPRITKYISGLQTELFWKILQHRHVDQDLAVAMLSCVPQGFSQLTLAHMKEKFGSRFPRMQVAAKIGQEYSLLCINQKMRDEYKAIEDSALWGKRLLTMKIPCSDTFTLSGDGKTALAKKVLSHKDATIELIDEFCEAFDVSKVDVLCFYLKALLVPTSAMRQFPLPEVMEKLRTLIAVLLRREDMNLMHNLNECFQRISPYDYERLLLVLNTMKQILSQSKPGIEKGILLLQVLMQYKRKVPPSHSETSVLNEADEEEFIRGDQAEARLATERLPFHLLMENQPWKLITTELISPEATNEMEPIVKALGLSVDQLYSVAIYEIGTKAMEATSSSQGKEDKGGSHPKYEVMQCLLNKMENPEMIIAAAKWVAKVLPLGEEKVEALKFCVETAKKWAAICGQQSISKAKETYYRFNSLMKRIHTESLLLDHNIQDEQYMLLCNQPAALICRLYEDFGTVDTASLGKISAVQDINQLVEKIADINDCPLDKLELHLLTKWLFGSSSENPAAAVDADMTMHNETNAMLNTEAAATSEEDSLKRVIYMLKGRDPSIVIRRLDALKPADSSHAARYSFKIRSMQALFSLLPASIIEEIKKKTLDHIREEFICYVYLRELETLHMSQSVVGFYKCNKEGLVKGLWRNHNHEHVAVRLITDLCIDYKIYEPQLWNVLLPKLLSFGMIHYLKHVLVTVSGVPELRELPCLPNMWKSVLNHPLQIASLPLSDEDEKNCLITAQLLPRCPVVLSLDILEFYELFKRLELFVQAMMCLSLVPNMRLRDSTLQELFTVGGIARILDDVKRQRNKYGVNWQIDEMEEEIFQFVYEHRLFAELHGTEHFDRMLSYLIQADLVETLVLMTLQLDRLNNAFQLVRMYARAHPKSETALSASEHTLNDLQTLTVFLGEKGLLNEAMPFLPIDDDEE